MAAPKPLLGDPHPAKRYDASQHPHKSAPEFFSDDDNPRDRATGASESRDNRGDGRSRTPMDDDMLKSIIASEIYYALGADGGRLSSERRRLLERYSNATGLGNEVDGRSSFIARNVYEAVEWVLPSAVDPFVSTDKLCEFQAWRPNEEQMTSAATDYINYIVVQENPWYKILYTWVKDCLIQKNSYVQAVWREENVVSHDSYTGLSDIEYQLVQQGDALRDKYPSLTEVEIVEHKEYPNGDPSSMQMFPTLHDVEVTVHETIGRVVIENIAPEEILVSRRAPEHLFDNKHFVCRRSLVRVTDLRERGYPEDLIQQSMGYDQQEFNSERIARFVKDDDWPLLGQRFDEAMIQVWLEESYISVDVDGDGVAELRRVVTCGQGAVLFENTPVDDLPFVSMTPIPMPHKHIGMSLAETVVDLEYLCSTVWRQAIDNLFLSNMPRPIVDEMSANESTWDDLLSPDIGAPIRVTNIEGIKWMEVPFTAQSSLPMLQLLEKQQEIRTGVSAQQVNLSPDDLNRFASGYAVNQMQQAGSKRIQLFQRNFADSIAQLCKKVLGLVVRHQDRAREVKIAGTWISFDPRTWRQSMDCTVNVGLGTNDKTQMLAHLMQLLQIQQTLVKEGQGTPYAMMVTPQNTYDLLDKIQENSGLRHSYFTDPRQFNPQQMQQMQQAQQNNPKMIEAQANAQAAKFQAQAEMELAQQKNQLEMQLEQQRHQAEMERDNQKFQAELARDHQREQFRMQLEQEKAALKQQQMMMQPVQPVNPNGSGI